MIRIAKRGYIEVPSRIAESCRGWEHPLEGGLSHHRWLITIDENSIDFLMKYHLIHTHWRFSLPVSYLKALPPKKLVQWLFWGDSFTFAERMARDAASQVAELEGFVQSVHPYPRWRVSADRHVRKAKSLANRATYRILRTLAGNHRTASEA